MAKKSIANLLGEQTQKDLTASSKVEVKTVEKITVDETEHQNESTASPEAKKKGRPKKEQGRKKQVTKKRGRPTKINEAEREGLVNMSVTIPGPLHERVNAILSARPKLYESQREMIIVALTELLNRDENLLEKLQKQVQKRTV